MIVKEFLQKYNLSLKREKTRKKEMEIGYIPDCELCK